MPAESHGTLSTVPRTNEIMRDQHKNHSTDTAAASTMPKRGMHSLVIAILVALAASAGLLLTQATPAGAHDGLISTFPEEDETLPATPTEVTLTFSGIVLAMDGTSIVEVVDTTGRNYAEGPPQIQGTTVTQKLTSDVAGGAFTVRWRVVSSDGHPTSGEYSYTVATVSLPEPTEPDPEETPETSPRPIESGEGEGHGQPTGGGKMSGFIYVGGVALLIGGIAFAALRTRSEVNRRRANSEPNNDSQ